jgi:integrase
MTTTLAASSLPAGLTAADIERIEAALVAGRTPATRTVYACAWRVWARWCATRGVPPLPASPELVCAYLTQRAQEGASVSTLEVACAAIGARHRDLDLPDPIRTQTVHLVRRGLRRTLGTAPRRPAHALDLTELTTMLASIDPTNPAGARDRALLLLGFASALRPSELAALAMADLEARPGGLLLHVRRSKTDPEARGQLVAVAPGRHAGTCPLLALDAWLDRRGTAPGPLFTAQRHRPVPGEEAISARAVSRIVARRARAAGLPSPHFTGHSLRAGHATTAAAAGAPLDRIAAQTRHTTLKTLLEHYIRPAQALAITTSRDLGL